MPLLKKNSYNTNIARMFRDRLLADNLYLFFGRTAVWTDENSPETPTEDITYEFETRGNMLGLKKVSQANTAFVVPRYTWNTGTVYAEYDANDANLKTKAFYVINRNFNVYKCIDNNNGANSIIEPLGTSTSVVTTGDGYSWKFMYGLSSAMQIDFLTNDWLPVPTGGQKNTFQTTVENNAVYANGSPVGGHGFSAYEELFSDSVMVSQSLDKSESGVFPTDIAYRQYGLLLNPRLISDNTLATGNVYSLNDSNASVDHNSGSLLYVNNRQSMSRSADQAEAFKIILKI